MKTIGKLDRVNPVIADESDPEVLAFAKAYLAGHRGEYRTIGKKTARDDVATERFFKRYESLVLRHGFAGTGEVQYTDRVSGRRFVVARQATGQSFYGTSHNITSHNIEVVA